jgi:hypothetical protein
MRAAVDTDPRPPGGWWSDEQIGEGEVLQALYQGHLPRGQEAKVGLSWPGWAEPSYAKNALNAATSPSMVCSPATIRGVSP